MSEHRYDIRISESCVDPNPLKVERQGADNFTRFQTRERCAFEIAAYVFNCHISLTDQYSLKRNTLRIYKGGLGASPPEAEEFF